MKHLDVLQARPS